MSEYNHKRMEARISEAIGTLLLTNEVKNPKIGRFVSISEVKLSTDSAYAVVWVSSLEADHGLEESVAALQSAAGFIQQRLGSILKTRNTPRLTFKADTSIRESEKINAIIDKLHQE